MKTPTWSWGWCGQLDLAAVPPPRRLGRVGAEAELHRPGEVGLVLGLRSLPHHYHLAMVRLMGVRLLYLQHWHTLATRRLYHSDGLVTTGTARCPRGPR